MRVGGLTTELYPRTPQPNPCAQLVYQLLDADAEVLERDPLRALRVDDLPAPSGGSCQRLGRPESGRAA